MSSSDFVYKNFSDFYSNPSTAIPLPYQVTQREFALFLFKEKTMVRHKAFANINSLRLFLETAVPSDVYHSSAYYESPESVMEKKGWLGADLIFDIDADHIPTSCNRLHDEWTCKNCGNFGKGVAPNDCPECGGQRFDTSTWPCELCLNSAKEETSKLINFLESDFGLSCSEIRVFFSGHRGYHVYVENEHVKGLDSIGRKEIVDYVSGLGHTLFKEAKKRAGKRSTSRHFELHDFGWDKRLKTGLRNFLLEAKKEDFKDAGINEKTILSNKKLLLKRCIEEGRWNSIRGIAEKTWEKLADYVKDLESAKIDTVVTTDVHRLIRLNGTLHGKTGFKKIEFPLKELGDFDPFKAAVAFKKGAIKLFVSNAPKFRLGDKVLGPFLNKVVELPTAAAILLICKGRAEVKDSYV